MCQVVTPIQILLNYVMLFQYNSLDQLENLCSTVDLKPTTVVEICCLQMSEQVKVHVQSRHHGIV